MRKDTAAVLAGYAAFVGLIFLACGTQGPNSPSSLASPAPIGPKPVPVGPSSRPIGPSGGPGSGPSAPGTTPPSTPGTASPSGPATPSAPPTPALVIDVSNNVGCPMKVCTFGSNGAGCANIHVDSPWVRANAASDPATFIQTCNANAAANVSPFMQFTVTRNAVVEVFFNHTQLTTGGTCAANFPGWAATGAGWDDGGNDEDVPNSAIPSQVNRFSDREMTVAAGATVVLGPNPLPGCDFLPLAYYVRVN